MKERKCRNQHSLFHAKVKTDTQNYDVRFIRYVIYLRDEMTDTGTWHSKIFYFNIHRKQSAELTDILDVWRQRGGALR
jgi:hypothetical protein